MKTSVVLPVHNEEQRLPKALQALLALQHNEIVVVDNGSTDRTLEVAREAAKRFTRVRVLHEGQRGKGLAVRRGMLESTGDICIMADVDLATPPDAWGALMEPLLRGDADIVIGSRRAPGAVVIQPLGRRLMGSVWRLLVHSMFPEIAHIMDTQCGFKAFSRAAADSIFSRAQTDGMAFDVEVLLLAVQLGYRISEVGVPWFHDGQTRVTLWDPLIMYAELNRLRALYPLCEARAA